MASGVVSWIRTNSATIFAVGVTIVLMRVMTVWTRRMSGKTAEERDLYWERMKGSPLNRRVDDFFYNLFHRLFPIGVILVAVALVFRFAVRR